MHGAAASRPNSHYGREPRVPKNPRDYQLYRAWYLAREASADGLRKRKQRAAARAAAIKAGKLSGPKDPREVDHRRSLSKGGTNRASNLRVTSQTANRRKYDH